MRKETLNRMPRNTRIPFAQSPTKTAKHVDWFSFHSYKDVSCRGPSFQGIPTLRAGQSPSLTFSFGLSLILWVAFDSTLVFSTALTFLLSFVRNFHCFFGLCTVSLRLARGAMHLTKFLFQISRTTMSFILLQSRD